MSRRIVLLSGGLDSATLMAQLASDRVSLEAVFVDYGQPAVRAERKSAAALARHYRAALRVLRVEGLLVASGEVPGRNALLVSLAMTSALPASASLHIAIHAGTGYRDCTPAFVELMNRYLDFHTNGTCKLHAPFVDMTKGDIVQLAKASGVPLAETYSCEAADTPCGKCASCRDREELVARCA